MKRRRRLKPPKEKPGGAYRQLWRVVDGAVTDALNQHPDYLTDRGLMHENCRRSITKRVVGAVMGYAEQSAKRRSVVQPGAGKKRACHEPSAALSI